MIPSMYEYPEGTIQSCLATSNWWVKKGNVNEVGQWDLLVALAPFFGNVPYRANLERVDQYKHSELKAKVEQFHIKKQKNIHGKGLPTAAFPDGAIIYAGKVRPVLVVAQPFDRIPKNIMQNTRAITKPVFLAAPYYGVEQDGTRGGFPNEFIERIKQANYPNYFWDKLPTELPYITAKECSSLLRLDQVFPIHKHFDNNVAVWASTGWTLSEDARVILKEWLHWAMHGEIKEDSCIASFKKYLLDQPNLPH